MQCGHGPQMALALDKSFGVSPELIMEGEHNNALSALSLG